MAARLSFSFIIVLSALLPILFLLKMLESICEISDGLFFIKFHTMPRTNPIQYDRQEVLQFLLDRGLVVKTDYGYVHGWTEDMMMVSQSMARKALAKSGIGKNYMYAHEMLRGVTEEFKIQWPEMSGRHWEHVYTRRDLFNDYLGEELNIDFHDLTRDKFHRISNVYNHYIRRKNRTLEESILHLKDYLIRNPERLQ